MNPDELPDGMRGRSFSGIYSAPAALGALAVAVFLFSRTMLVSPGKLDLEIAALALVAVAAFCWCAFSEQVVGVQAPLEERQDLRGRNKQLVIVVGGTFLLLVFVLAIGDSAHAWTPPLPKEISDQRNASLAVLGMSALLVALLTAAVLGWTPERPPKMRRIAVAIMLACVVTMIVRTVVVHPQLPPFHMGESPA